MDPGRSVCGWALCSSPFSCVTHCRVWEVEDAGQSDGYLPQASVLVHRLFFVGHEQQCGPRAANFKEILQGWWVGGPPAANQRSRLALFLEGEWQIADTCFPIQPRDVKYALGMPESASSCLSLWSLVLLGGEGVVDSVKGGELRRSRGRNCTVNGTEILVLMEQLLIVLQVVLLVAMINVVTH